MSQRSIMDADPDPQCLLAVGYTEMRTLVDEQCAWSFRCAEFFAEKQSVAGAAHNTRMAIVWGKLDALLSLMIDDGELKLAIRAAAQRKAAREAPPAADDEETSCAE